MLLMRRYGISGSGVVNGHKLYISVIDEFPTDFKKKCFSGVTGLDR